MRLQIFELKKGSEAREIEEIEDQKTDFLGLTVTKSTKEAPQWKKDAINQINSYLINVNSSFWNGEGRNRANKLLFEINNDKNFTFYEFVQRWHLLEGERLKKMLLPVVIKEINQDRNGKPEQIISRINAYFLGVKVSLDWDLLGGLYYSDSSFPSYDEICQHLSKPVYTLDEEYEQKIKKIICELKDHNVQVSYNRGLMGADFKYCQTQTDKTDEKAQNLDGNALLLMQQLRTHPITISFNSSKGCRIWDSLEHFLDHYLPSFINYHLVYDEKEQLLDKEAIKGKVETVIRSYLQYTNEPRWIFKDKGAVRAREWLDTIIPGHYSKSLSDREFAVRLTTEILNMEGTCLKTELIRTIQIVLRINTQDILLEMKKYTGDDDLRRKQAFNALVKARIEQYKKSCRSISVAGASHIQGDFVPKMKMTAWDSL